MIGTLLINYPRRAVKSHGIFTRFSDPKEIMPTMYYEPLKERLSSVCKVAYRKVSKVKTPREK